MRSDILVDTDKNAVVMAQYNIPAKEMRLDSAPLVILGYGLQRTHKNTPRLFSNISGSLERMGLTSLIYDYSIQQHDEQYLRTLCCECVVKDLNALFMWARENQYEKIAFITEGLGAPFFFMNLPENTVFCVLLWPILDLDAFVTEQMNHIDHNQALCLDDHFLNNMTNKELKPVLESVHVPTLILQGQQDQIVPPIHLEQARRHLMAPWLDITTFENGTHGLAHANHEKASLQHIENFVKKYAQRDLLPKNTEMQKIFSV
ncbi:MAG: prolyl oligopeptidase family serine peptidase [Alphaproteobacteria bacterium]